MHDQPLDWCKHDPREPWVWIQPGNYTHGTLYAYRTKLCRCPDCRAAKNRETRRWRAARLARGVPAKIVYGHAKRTGA